MGITHSKINLSAARVRFGGDILLSNFGDSNQYRRVAPPPSTDIDSLVLILLRCMTGDVTESSRDNYLEVEEGNFWQTHPRVISFLDVLRHAKIDTAEKLQTRVSNLYSLQGKKRADLTIARINYRAIKA
jgi:hypothetical protein